MWPAYEAKWGITQNQPRIASTRCGREGASKELGPTNTNGRPRLTAFRSRFGESFAKRPLPLPQFLLRKPLDGGVGLFAAHAGSDRHGKRLHLPLSFFVLLFGLLHGQK